MGTVYLIPTILAEGATQCLPAYVLDAVKACSVFFVEDERTARRYLKSIWREMVIDDQEWFTMKKVTDETAAAFRQRLKDGKNIAVISEAGCPGVADPGQKLAALAQEMNATVRPLVGPNSILLALMASGLNGQQFQFVGYIPISAQERIATIKALEAESKTKRCTQIFIETPYRNNQLLETLTKTCHAHTRICVAVDLTAASESVTTKTAQGWKAAMPELHKRPAIFLMLAEG
ncbi:MAG: SAM-dependent methyltransferase [Flaviaesturariibacter sp.]|nr:SAM-dependent methyltransferase [Flaviaesturariibacter sp.]